jgi:hypothetical protein
MATISESELSWNERAFIFNYRCRLCREQITFLGQELYFANGLCTSCLNGLDRGRNDSMADAWERLQYSLVGSRTDILKN